VRARLGWLTDPAKHINPNSLYLHHVPEYARSVLHQATAVRRSFRSDPVFYRTGRTGHSQYSDLADHHRLFELHAFDGAAQYRARVRIYRGGGYADADQDADAAPAQGSGRRRKRNRSTRRVGPAADRIQAVQIRAPGTS